MMCRNNQNSQNRFNNNNLINSNKFLNLLPFLKTNRMFKHSKNKPKYRINKMIKIYKTNNYFNNLFNFNNTNQANKVNKNKNLYLHIVSKQLQKKFYLSKTGWFLKNT